MIQIILAISALAAVQAAGQRVLVDDLVREALASNAEIHAAQKRYEAARQRPVQASALPDPMVSPGYNSNGAPWPGAGLGTEPTSNIGVMVSQEIPYPGKRKLAGSIAAKDAEAEFESYQQVQLSVMSRLKQAYYRLAFTYSAIDVLERSLALLRKLHGIGEIRYSVGKTEQQDVLRSQTQMSLLETRLIPLQREIRVREAEINTLLNRAPNTPVGQPVDLAPLALPAGLDELRAAARDNSPIVRRDEKMIQRSELAVNAARRDYYPDITLNGGYYNMGGMPDMYMFRADIKVPLYWFRKQRPGVTERATEVAQARRTLEATGRTLSFRIEDDYTMAEASLKLVSVYRDTVIPQASLTLESSLSSYETGKVDFVTVLGNYIAILEYEMNYYEQLQNAYLAIVRLEEMTGKRLLS